MCLTKRIRQLFRENANIGVIGAVFVINVLVSINCGGGGGKHKQDLLGTETATINNEGGKLQIDQFEVIIPPGTVSEPVQITVKEYDSFSEDVSQFLNSERYHRFGSVYSLEVPFFSDNPMSLNME